MKTTKNRRQQQQEQAVDDDGEAIQPMESAAPPTSPSVSAAITDMSSPPPSSSSSRRIDFHNHKSNKKGSVRKIFTKFSFQKIKKMTRFRSKSEGDKAITKPTSTKLSTGIGIEKATSAETTTTRAIPKEESPQQQQQLQEMASTTTEKMTTRMRNYMEYEELSSRRRYSQSLSDDDDDDSEQHRHNKSSEGGRRGGFSANLNFSDQPRRKMSSSSSSSPAEEQEQTTDDDDDDYRKQVSFFSNRSLAVEDVVAIGDGGPLGEKGEESSSPPPQEQQPRRRRSSERRSSVRSIEYCSLPNLNYQQSLEIQKFVKSQRIKEWCRIFRRSDPRYQILHFFNDVAQAGASDMEDGFDPIKISPLLRAFYKASVFTVWRPTSYDAIRRMMLGEGVGKGLNIKGKSAKRGRLSGFVPFLQIHEESHKAKVRNRPKDGRFRVFYQSSEDRDVVHKHLTTVAEEMQEALVKADVILANEENEDDETLEWAFGTQRWTMTDPSIYSIDDYAPKRYGLDVPMRLFWEALIQRQSIYREPDSDDDTGRNSVPQFQDMNIESLNASYKNEQSDDPKTVIMHYVDPNDNIINPLNPLDLLMAYEEENAVMPVVSDFDCFLVGTRGVEYKDPLPSEQLDVLMWCVNQIELIMEEDSLQSQTASAPPSWTNRWLDVLKHEKLNKEWTVHIPPLGFSDPKSNSIMKRAIYRLRKEGAVRHGAECFNYYFPQELDQEFLIISDDLPGTTLPWKYVDGQGLQEILKDKIDMGYTFPINPKWILCDPGWRDVYNRLMASKRSNVQDSLRIWYPPESGIREKIEEIFTRWPDGFHRNARRESAMVDGTTAWDLAEQELKAYLTFQRARRKLRGMLVWKSLLDDLRKRKKEREREEEEQKQIQEM